MTQLSTTVPSVWFHGKRIPSSNVRDCNPCKPSPKPTGSGIGEYGLLSRSGDHPCLNIPKEELPRTAVGTEKASVLSKLAFGSLWLLAFAISWEDAVTIPNFGTSARLIGMVCGGLGILAILERGRVRRPSPGHILMALFVMLAAVSYLWSLYPEGTLAQVLTYSQLLMMVWLIWEFAAGGREQMRLLQAYVLGTFVSGMDTVYLFLSHQESVYQRYAGARLDANDLGLMMALSIPVSYYLVIQSKGLMAWVYRLQLILAVTTVLLTASRGATAASIAAFAIVPLTHSRLTGRQKIAVLLTVSVLICGALLYVPSSSWERLSTMPSVDSFAGYVRKAYCYLEAGWEIFRSHPFPGHRSEFVQGCRQSCFG